ncbi:type I methionyl aminopeptidase [Nostoc sp. 'Peltigera membranacea cyanobiont' 213]|uniref:type I methionyl aminopeptidase n=1 Tax=unclassified Nostoc TaxID=2593658 RepID=UPI000B9522C6|nr:MULTISPECIES: type I methionyl aminopeptidase [unclassified Nostoc]MBD2508228.1 type I methionyl aminopeptidase [Desmonostoc muscorum FACHB-395]AVH67547.1 methionine aminopeptidase [Nostoc sp. 'Peltigera membranacea cyanobiont' N6]OYD87035.1 type I methionyl aminopeptidase [Nostoc sp. 'Peltigera membranacea cyanobiont' 213]OYE00644.1 type I methionyl aminopeptidase [Nostoc sp. 'Peltigera membranacea cyanobiont' 232]QHG15954.1 type I methionyl aminopeptidase [Nostoc sp. ATCC 53789]
MNIFSNLLSQTTQPATSKKKGRGIEIKSSREIEIMRQSSAIVATVLKEISELVKPGMTTADLDAHAEKRIREMGATPSFKGYHGFPGSICSSINNEAVHGIPSPKKVIRVGDVLKVDTGAYYQGFHGDSCISIAVGEVTEEAAKLIRVAEEALFKGIEQVKAGVYLLDLAGAIEDHVKANGFSIVEEFTGHGVGRNLHEEPSVFNYRTREMPNVKLRAGMTLAIEPILNAGSRHTRTLSDRWTAVTVDNSLSAQFEHTVLVTDTGYEILTDRSKV